MGDPYHHALILAGKTSVFSSSLFKHGGPQHNPTKPDKVLLCASRHSLTAWWVDTELNRAFAKEQQLYKQRGKKVLAVIPLSLDGYLFNSECDHPKAEEIRSRLAADFTGWEHDNAKFEREIERVIRALRADSGGREAPPTPKL